MLLMMINLPMNILCPKCNEIACSKVLVHSYTDAYVCTCGTRNCRNKWIYCQYCDMNVCNKKIFELIPTLQRHCKYHRKTNVDDDPHIEHISPIDDDTLDPLDPDDEELLIHGASYKEQLLSMWSLMKEIGLPRNIDILNGDNVRSFFSYIKHQERISSILKFHGLFPGVQSNKLSLEDVSIHINYANLSYRLPPKDRLQLHHQFNPPLTTRLRRL